MGITRVPAVCIYHELFLVLGQMANSYCSSTTEHIFSDSDIFIREDEPSSLIAFTLTMPDYQGKLENIRHESSSSASMEDRRRPGIAGDLERSLLKGTGTHIKYRTLTLK